MKNGGRTTTSVFISLWVRTTFHSTQLFFHQAWLPPKWAGHYFTTFQLLNTWTTNQANSQREVELVCSVMLLLKQAFLQKSGDTTCSSTDQKSQILSSVGKSLSTETTMNFWPIWATFATEHWNTHMQTMRTLIFQRLVYKTLALLKENSWKWLMRGTRSMCFLLKQLKSRKDWKLQWRFHTWVTSIFRTLSSGRRRTCNLEGNFLLILERRS